MLLVVDVGNTEIVFGLYEIDLLKAHWRLSSKMQRTSDESWIVLKMWCESYGMPLSEIDGMVIASVVPALTGIFIEVAEKYLKIDPVVVTSETDTGMKILYDTPRTVGADRICNAIAGYARYGGPLIVVDFGTATTFDVVSKKGEYVGGVITLGLKGVSQELHRLAAKLPKVDLIFPASVVGRTTDTSIQSGIMWGAVALVDGMVSRIVREMNWKDVTVVTTGGMAPAIVERMKRSHIVEPFLTLEGLRLIFERVNKKRR